jgi:hypothetical protein
MAHYSDEAGKAILRDTSYWPTRTQQWGVASNSEYWIRCRPSDTAGDKRPLPRLSLPGASLFTTQPDGMWVYFRGFTCADVLAVEICGSMQNLNDKRSRYVSTGTGLMLVVPATWFGRPITLQHGAQEVCGDATGCFRGIKYPTSGDLRIPVRFLRALFVIPDAQFRHWQENHVPAGHEFFMKHNSLKSGTGPAAQKFLGGMSFQAHFYTRH